MNSVPGCSIVIRNNQLEPEQIQSVPVQLQKQRTVYLGFDSSLVAYW